MIFPIFVNRVTQQVGFYGAVRYTALLIGILLAATCFLVKSRLPRKTWNPDLKWFDVSLFKDRVFLLYTFGSYFVMFVPSSSVKFLMLILGRWGLWAPFDYLPSMAQGAGFSTTNALYLISIVKSVLQRGHHPSTHQLTHHQCHLYPWPDSSSPHWG